MKPKQLFTLTNITIAVISLAFAISIIRSLLQLYEISIFYDLFSKIEVMRERYVDVFYILIASIALILFVLRLRVGWFLVVAYLAVVCVLHISNFVGEYKELLERSNRLVENIDYLDAWAEMPKDREGTLAQFASAHRRSLLIMTGIWTAMISFVLLPFLKGVRRVYNISNRTAILTLCVAAVSATIFNAALYGSFERSVRITPIDTNAQVIVRYNSRSSEITHISFPFAFEFRNRSLLNMQIGIIDVFRDDEENEIWERRFSRFFSIRDSRLIDNRGNYDWSRTNIFRTQRFIVCTSYRDERRRSNTMQLLQPYFQPYIDEIHRRIELSDFDYVEEQTWRYLSLLEQRQQVVSGTLLHYREGVYSLSVGTIQEFMQRHPDLSRTLLQGDSIFFGVGIERFYRGNERNDWRGGGIRFPIAYSIDEMRGRRKLTVW